MIDLRSDTVTRPTSAMREAMARAEVGDDVFGEDPTVARLEARAAEMLGTERALYVPSGTMANQVALQVHCRPGDDVLVGWGAHSYLYESGASGALAGVQLTICPSPAGRPGLFTAETAEPLIKAGDPHYAPTALIMAENSHNRGGGLVFPLEALRGLRRLADEHGLKLHIDGARLLNAAAAEGTDPRVYGELAHSLSLCFSKGLGAPVGSVLAGSADFVEQAHRYRKMLGGGMRQAGIIAAGALHALDHHVDRLADDHRRARRFAEQLATREGFSVELANVQTNIVIFDVVKEGTSASEVEARAGQLGLSLFAVGPSSLRAVFHLHIDDTEVEQAVVILARALEPIP